MRLSDPRFTEVFFMGFRVAAALSDGKRIEKSDLEFAPVSLVKAIEIIEYAKIRAGGESNTVCA